MKDCIFCKLISGEIPPKFIYESDLVVAFYDTRPQADVHILVVPKKHISDFLALGELDSDLTTEIISVIQKLTKETKSDKIGYRIAISGGRYQEVPHLHWHLLGDKTAKRRPRFLDQ